MTSGRELPAIQSHHDIAHDEIVPLAEEMVLTSIGLTSVMQERETAPRTNMAVKVAFRAAGIARALSAVMLYSAAQHRVHH